MNAVDKMIEAVRKVGVTPNPPDDPAPEVILINEVVHECLDIIEARIEKIQREAYIAGYREGNLEGLNVHQCFQIFLATTTTGE